MNQHAIMETSTNTSKTLLWLGIGLTALLVLFLAADGIAKVFRVPKVLEANQKLGIAPELVRGIGILLLVCTALYAFPKTAILGAILLTGYLGGATAVHVITRGGTFPIAFSIAFGVLAWAGLALREPRLVRWILFRMGN
jgi:DoxX-like family